jgi:UDP-N-acetylmuramyl pentapeptide phosphotransferase/UDP-N-acetylglucosamine-1-phosphate transferase
LISIGLTRLLVAHAGRLGMMDQPGERRVHVTPIPRAGGLAIWLSFMLVSFGLFWLAPEWFGHFSVDWLIPFAVSSLILVAVGLADDRAGLKAWWKLLGQITAAAVFFMLRPAGDGSMLGFDMSPFLAGLAFVIWAVLLINAFNLIDGLDGLCGGLALVALVPLGFIAALNGHLEAMAAMWIMAAAVLGFLKYNLNPARIFLGDTGSMMLGFFIAAAATQPTGRRAILGAILLPIAVAGVPLLDVLLAVWRRSGRKLLNQWTGGERVGIFDADKDHLHHRLLIDKSQKKVTRLLHAVASLLATLAFLPLIFGDRVLGISLIGLLIVVLLGLRNFARIELVQSGSVLHLALKRPGGNRRLRVAAFAYDCLALSGCALLARWLETDLFKRDSELLVTVQFTVLFVVLGMLGIYLSKAYRRVWSRATLRDLLSVMVWVGAAGLLCGTLFSLAWADASFATARVSVMATGLAMLAVPLPRCFVEILRELAVDAGHRHFNNHADAGERPVLIYGAGDQGNLFIDYLKTCPPARCKDFRVLGLVDENPDLKGRIMRGFQVMGNLESLDELAASRPLHGVIITIDDPDAGQLQRLREIAGKRGFNIYSWCHDLTPAVVDIHRPALEVASPGARNSPESVALEPAQ